MNDENQKSYELGNIDDLKKKNNAPDIDPTDENYEEDLQAQENQDIIDENAPGSDENEEDSDSDNSEPELQDDQNTESNKSETEESEEKEEGGDAPPTQPQKVSIKELCESIINIDCEIKELTRKIDSIEKAVSGMIEVKNKDEEAISKLDSLLQTHEKGLQEIQEKVITGYQATMAVLDAAEVEMRQVQRRNLMFVNFFPSWQTYHEDLQEYVTQSTAYITSEAKRESQEWIDKLKKQSEENYNTVVKEYKSRLEELGERYKNEIKKLQKAPIKLPPLEISQMAIPTAISFIAMIVVYALGKLM